MTASLAKSILIIGSGGRTKFGFLRQLLAYGYRPFVIDPISNSRLVYPSGVVSYFVESLGRHELLRVSETLAAKNLFKGTASIYEPCLEGAALVREALGHAGFGIAETAIARNKHLMYEFLIAAGIAVAPFERINVENREGASARLRSYPWPCVLKPPFGWGNIGVKVIRPERAPDEALSRAVKEYYMGIDGTFHISDPHSDWLLCEYISGKEVEVDQYVVSGKTMFRGIHEKTLIRQHGSSIEENNAVTPVLTLTPEELSAIDEVTEKLALAVHERLAEPRGIRSFMLYSEYRMENKRGPICLEFSLRIGGGLVPLSLQRSTGTDLFKLAAASIAGIHVRPSSHSRKRACYWQVLYSDRPGIYRGCDFSPVNGVKFIPIMRIGERILVPQSDYLAYVIAGGVAPEAASERAKIWLSKAVVKVETNDGVRLVPVPLPP
jgi:biotin carboxylase